MASNYSGSDHGSSIYSDDEADSDIINLAETIKNNLIIDDNLSIMTVNVSNAKKSWSANAAERRNFVSTLINTLYPDIVLLQECIRKDLNEINNEIEDDFKTVYTYYYKDKQSGVMIKKCINDDDYRPGHSPYDVIMHQNFLLRYHNSFLGHQSFSSGPPAFEHCHRVH